MSAAAPLRGDEAIRFDGFSYLPRFFDVAEARALADVFEGLHPVWERRYADERRRGGRGRLNRPVYWLGAWQFAALGYYAEPDHVVDKCVRAEPIPDVLTRVLDRLRPELAEHGHRGSLPNTCLVNYYGSDVSKPGGPPVDLARVGLHRDREPGPVVMLSVGQPALFELVDLDTEVTTHSQWVRHRSAVILSGPEVKDRLYHRVVRVRHGQEPVLASPVDGFRLRRVSVSFRFVPEQHIYDLADLGPEARAIARPGVEELAEHSAHYRRQLEALERA